MTTGVKFLYQFGVGNYNLTNPGANILSVTDQFAGDYLPVNLTTWPLRETYRSLNATGWKEIVISADDTVTIPDTFAILNHNFSSTSVVELVCSMTSSFPSGSLTLQFQYNEENMVLLQSPGFAFRYYKIRILDPLNTCGFLEIGRIIGGLSVTMTNNEDLTDDITIAPQDMGYQYQTEGFFYGFNERVQVDQLTINFSELQTIAGENQNYLAIREMVKQVGMAYPFLTIVDPSDPYFELCWGQIMTMPSFASGVNRYSTFQLIIQQLY